MYIDDRSKMKKTNEYKCIYYNLNNLPVTWKAYDEKRRYTQAGRDSAELE